MPTLRSSGVMTVGEYHAKIEYDEELDLFRGEILGRSGGADFYGKNPKELRAEFKKSLEVFLAVCKEKGIEAFSIGPHHALRIEPTVKSQ